MYLQKQWYVFNDPPNINIKFNGLIKYDNDEFKKVKKSCYMTSAMKY